jgi:hypothetical protein
MGLFANLAAKSEIRMRDSVFGLYDEFAPDLEKGHVLLPCHIIEEAHNGFFLRNGDKVFGFFHCQLRWWVKELSNDLVARLQSPGAALAMKELSLQPVADCGGVRDPHGFVFSSAAAMQIG